MSYEVRADARSASWLVARQGRRSGTALRIDAGGGETELGRSAKRLGLDRVGLAAAVLRDARDTEPSYRLASDFALFIVPETPDATKAMTAEELQAWIDTWKPPFERLFPGVEKRLRKRS